MSVVELIGWSKVEVCDGHTELRSISPLQVAAVQAPYFDTVWIDRAPNNFGCPLLPYYLPSNGSCRVRCTLRAASRTSNLTMDPQEMALQTSRQVLSKRHVSIRVDSNTCIALLITDSRVLHFL